jgi:hypothetical protein
MLFLHVRSLDGYEEMLRPGTDHNLSYYGQLWRTFLSEPQLRIAVNCIRPVGASDGEETCYICLDIHVAAKTAHSYPIGRAKADQIMGNAPVFCVDDLNC